MRRAWPLVLVLVAGCAALRSLVPEDRPFFIPPEAARVSGAHSQAIAVAFNDWMAELARDKADALALTGRWRGKTRMAGGPSCRMKSGSR